MPDRKPKPQHGLSAETKACTTCGRTITWRKKWQRDWEQIKFCSDSCRTHKPSTQDKLLEDTILKLLGERGQGKTIFPSEAARVMAGDDQAAWQPLMEPARAAARRLVAEGLIVITQGGHTVDPSTAKGPIRLRLR